MTIETADMLSQEQGITAPGTILALRRKELGWSEREVADKLCLLPKQVIALEDNHFESFSAQIFVKGYLRSYAKLVSLDDDGLLSLYEQHYQQPALQQASVENTLTNLPAQQPASRRYLGVAAAVSVIVVLWLFSGADKSKINTVVDAVDPIMHEEHVDTVIKIDSHAIAETNATDELVTAQIENPQAVNVFKDESPLEIAAVEITENENASLITEQSTQSITVKADNTIVDRGDLKVEFSGDCWVEVRDVNGSVLFKNMKRDGEILNVNGLPPFRVLLGNATVVSVSYNGEPIIVNPSADNQSARITIGS